MCISEWMNAGYSRWLFQNGTAEARMHNEVQSDRNTPLRSMPYTGVTVYEFQVHREFSLLLFPL